MKITLIATFLCLFCAYAGSAQTIRLKNERIASDSVLYVGISNNFQVSDLPAGTTIGSKTVYCRLDGNRLTLMPEKLGEADIFFSSASGVVTGKKHFIVKRLPSPFALVEKPGSGR